MGSFKEYSFQYHEEVYRVVDSIMNSFGYHYYLIGANARDIQLYKAKVRPLRATADIDFAVMIPTEEKYEAFVDTLLNHGFKRAHQKYRVLYEKSDTVVDILPYGAIAEEYTLNFNERDVELSVLGFEEVGEEKENFEIVSGFSIPTTPIHGLIILKLISWNDRKDRNKDLKDIRSLLDAAWELYQEDLFSENSPHLDLLDEKDFDVGYVTARMIGRKINPILQKCEPLKKRITTLLKEEVANPSAMTLGMSIRNDSEKVINLLEALLKGIYDH
jgi:predicted nucleotidyltransferase